MAQPKEKMYRVTWGIGVLALSHEEAARKARAIQLDPESEATIFYVRYNHGKSIEIDVKLG